MSLPSLKDLVWKYADSLPEIKDGYDDSKWVDADHTTTTSKFPRYYGGPWNLSVASDYGYHVRIYRLIPLSPLLTEYSLGRKHPLERSFHRRRTKSGQFINLRREQFRRFGVVE